MSSLGRLHSIVLLGWLRIGTGGVDGGVGSRTLLDNITMCDRVVGSVESFGSMESVAYASAERYSHGSV